MSPKFLITLALFTLILGRVMALMVNPAAAYCIYMGYEYEIEKTELGEKGYCILPNNQKVDAWDFFYCRVAKEYSYCYRIGLEAESKKDGCYCVFKNGTKVEVTKLINLTLGSKPVCGDGSCDFLDMENYRTCPQDCPSGSLDLYCDGIKDNKCDPDCIRLNEREKDPDCPICGNKICEYEKGENHLNCSVDCPQSSLDGICEKIEDNKL